ncbi:type II protein arginine methyltransferase [Sporobolomyces salmoneus]|uniref:type II protein arginine methyltransferase n=1 Tax=Sporobolomyces salmoneus TaxID=183962 RepID=UPI003181B10F
MLVRDFIDDSLYNPNYGYFSTKVDIFDPDTTTATRSKRSERVPREKEDDRAEGFEFDSFATTAEFEEEVARRYMQFEGLDQGAGTVGKGPGRQVWHTPTELFKPWYGRALARYLLATYKLNLYPYSDLIIYEIGAGNGTLMADILDFLAVEAPEVYARTKYRIIEISDRLVGKQKGSVAGGSRRKEQGGMSEGEMGREKARRRGHGDRVEVIGKSIFEWDRVVHEPCFFIAMEVLDNFAHDVIRYTTDTHEPVQCTISIDASGDYNELYSPVDDPLIARYLSLRSKLLSTSSSRESRALNPLLASSPLLRKIYSSMPFAPNLTQPEFIPTRQLQLLEVLRDKFPNHRVLMSDFDKLPDAVAGVNAPVVQTRYQGETVPCTTYLVQPGFFDIFFPTDFEALREMYTLVMSQPRKLSSSSSSSKSESTPTLNHDTLTPSPSPNAPPSRLSADFFSPHSHPSPRPSSSPATSVTPTKKDAVLPGLGHSKGLQVVDHADFLERWGETDRTRTRDGSNPMIESYLNAKFFL